MYIIYSDGGCRGNPGPGAYATIIENESGHEVYQEVDGHDQTTNNIMEIQGVIAGLKFLAQKNDVSSVKIVSDSQYVLKGIREWMPSWKARGWRKADKKAPSNLELWQEIDNLISRFDCVETKWVKGHSGHEQNERCDALLNQYMDDRFS